MRIFWYKYISTRWHFILYAKNLNYKNKLTGFSFKQYQKLVYILILDQKNKNKNIFNCAFYYIFSIFSQKNR